ncbi:uncharacterized protein unc isoform X3 [Drosophila virilis]|nr:uncharacterized protein LOC6631592 isoform X3 [Drosophila virilis]KRF82328.1 uncharacterized protein Dvir_GJ18786, isoform B [Drosophila virilis]
MKTKQKPTAAAATSAATSAAGSTRLTTVRQRSKEEDLIRLRQRQPQPQPQQCERERKHEAARKEREAQAQLKRAAVLRRRTPSPALASAPSTARPFSKPINDRAKPQPAKAVKQPEKIHIKPDAASTAVTYCAGPAPAAATGNGTAAATTPGSGSSSGTTDEETAKLRLQLEHLAQLSQQDFEREFRHWMTQEGIEGKMHAHLRMDLINTFNSTSLGQLLSKASATAAQVSQQQNCLLLSPIALALHTLVAEFLYEQNFHYTLSVFCSEMPHRHTLPDFEGRAEFRFNQEELQQVLTAVLGEHRETPAQFGQTLVQTYSKPKQSLLLALLKTLVGLRRTDLTQISESTMTHRTWETRTEATQTEPDVDKSRLYQTEELVAAADGRTVFIGPRVSQSLNGVEQQLSQLMHYMNALCKSCAPPVEIIPYQAFEKLLQQEILERERLLVTGQTLGPGQTAIQLPELTQVQETQVARQDGNTVLSPVGPIQLPADSPSVPKLPHLHAEQVASLAMVQQALQKFQQQTHQPQDCMYITLDRLEALVGELAGCVQTLSNVLNLAMEQEYAVGRHKGFKLGYREGFSHGHYMGVQEGMQCQKKQQHRDTSSQTQTLSAPSAMQTVATQTRRLRQRHITTNTDPLQQCLKDAASQTTPAPVPVAAAAPVPAPAPATKAAPSRSYEQWIYEMLHSHSGHIFLERVELSLNKALEQQKQRLDELFDVKLRHHAELMRLSRRQSSWRTLCRHVERDSHSSEARELVHKIFRLLEHYEAHHQLLAEKIQQTELAAEQTARIQPVWTDAEINNDVSRLPSALSRPKSKSPPVPPASTARTISASFPHSVLGLDASSTGAGPTAPPAPAAAVEPPRPQLNSVATNTNGQIKHTIADARAQVVPSFNEALLSAK